MRRIFLYGAICCLQRYTSPYEGPIPSWSGRTGPDGQIHIYPAVHELLALPGMEEQDAAEVRDQLPVSGSGKTITTVEPKFIPREAVNVNLGEEIPVKIRLIELRGI